MSENFSVLEDIRRQDWLSVYINAIAEEFDPHTFYFAPSDKDRFDAQMAGKYEGIGARPSKAKWTRLQSQSLFLEVLLGAKIN